MLFGVVLKNKRYNRLFFGGRKVSYNTVLGQ